MKSFKRLLILAVAVLLAVSCAVASPAKEYVTCSIRSLKPEVYSTKYGNLYTDLRTGKLLRSGYEYGDIVYVDFLEYHLEMPIVPDYSSLDSGALGFVAKPHGRTQLCYNMADFAETYKIATKITNEDKSWYWQEYEGIEFPIEITISMAEKGGYKDKIDIRSLERTNKRSDYKDLSDADFANFRKVETTGMHNLYRTSNPVDSELKRNKIADKEIKKVGIKTILNLADTKEEAEKRPEFSKTYYSTCNVDYLCLGLDFNSEDIKKSLADGFRFIIEHEGPYAVHCTEGKDRAGFVCALLECLMGASLDEVSQDYMKTYENYYHVQKGTEKYNCILEANILATLQTVFDVDDICTANLQRCAEIYIKSCGLSESEINLLRANL